MPSFLESLMLPFSGPQTVPARSDAPDEEPREESHSGYGFNPISPGGDNDNWMLIASGSRILNSPDKAGPEPYRVFLRTLARRAVRFNPHGRAILRSFCKYAIGRVSRPRWGDAIDGDKKKRKNLDTFWRACATAWDWDVRGTEIAERLIRDGECILRAFVDKVDVYIDGKPRTVKMLVFRFIDPECVRDTQTQQEEDGVITEPDDVEKMKALKVVKANDHRTYIGDPIPAKELVFAKMESDMNERRGMSMLGAVLPYATMHDSWLMDRVVLNRVRSSVALVRSFDGSGTDVARTVNAEDATEKAKRGTAWFARGASNDTKMKRMRPGTVINAPKGVKYEFINPNLSAADVQHDGFAIRMSVAAGMGIAEFMVSADPSKANYGAQLAAEGPATKEFIDFQHINGKISCKMLRMAVEYQRAYGRDQFGIPEDFDPTAVTWQHPTVAVRSRVHEIQADTMAVRHAIMSRKTAMERDGLDYDVETARMKDEAKDYEEIAPTIPSGSGGPIATENDGGPNGGTNGAKPGVSRNRGPSDGDPNDTRDIDPEGTPSDSST